jgi:hypothetical protein
MPWMCFTGWKMTVADGNGVRRLAFLPLVRYLPNATTN